MASLPLDRFSNRPSPLPGPGNDPDVREEVDVDAETAAAIQRGIDDADTGRVITLEEARSRMLKWLSRPEVG